MLAIDPASPRRLRFRGGGHGRLRHPSDRGGEASTRPGPGIDVREGVSGSNRRCSDRWAPAASWPRAPGTHRPCAASTSIATRSGVIGRRSWPSPPTGSAPPPRRSSASKAAANGRARAGCWPHPRARRSEIPAAALASRTRVSLLVDVLGVSEFVDADVLARSLPRSEAAAVTAGRAVLRRLDELAAARQSFGFETTLASRSFAPRIRRLLNFFSLYRSLTTTWRMYDNSADTPRLIAAGAGAETLAVNDAAGWRRIRAGVGDEG
jgi:hypothetical protein